MIKINLHEAKTHLSHYISLVEAGKSVVVCRRNVPVAQLKPLTPSKKKRQLGLSRGKVRMKKSFFDPLPGNILDAFADPS